MAATFVVCVIAASGSAVGAEGQPAPPPDKIVRGTAVPDGVYPWAVSIHRAANPSTNNLVCTGSHIHPQWVLTAKHCLDEDEDNIIEPAELGPDELWFSFNRTKISERSRGHVIRGQGAVLNRGNDMALVLVERPSTAPLVALGTAAPANSTPVTVAGWGGSTVGSPNGAIPDNMQRGSFKVTGTSSSDGPDLKYRNVNNEELCGGDSGAPVFTTAGGVTRIVAVHTNSPRACGVNTGDATGSRVDRALTWIRNNVPAQYGFVWADSPTTPSYSPSAPYSHSTNGVNTVTRLGTGFYDVRMGGLAGPDGNVQVTAYGTTSNRCKSAGWAPIGADQTVQVRCFTAAGVAADTTFVAQFYRAGAGDTQQTAYVLADSPLASSYTPRRTYSWNSKGGTNTITRNSTGVYTVNLPGFTTVGGNVAVTAYGGGTEYCKVGGWGASTVTVRCFNAGSPADTSFTMRYTDKQVAGRIGGWGAYMWASDPSSPGYTPDPTYAFHTAGSTITAGRTANGTYQVTIPALILDRTSVMVTGYGATTSNCAVASWFPNGTGGTTVDVRCYSSSGARTDSQFTLSYVTNR